MDEALIKKAILIIKYLRFNNTLQFLPSIVRDFGYERNRFEKFVDIIPFCPLHNGFYCESFIPNEYLRFKQTYENYNCGNCTELCWSKFDDYDKLKRDLGFLDDSIKAFYYEDQVELLKIYDKISAGIIKMTI